MKNAGISQNVNTNNQKNFGYYRFFIIFALVFFVNVSYSQKKNNQTINDTTYVHEHSPRKAVILSAILPGLGQAYNKKYWKIPIIYMGVGALYYLSEYNTKNYELFRDAYAYIDLRGPVVLYEGSFQKETLRKYKEFYKRSRDLNYIMMGGLYLLNLIDATVDAHLFDYDVSEDLTFKIEPNIPVIYHHRGISYAYGMSCRISF